MYRWKIFRQWCCNCGRKYVCRHKRTKTGFCHYIVLIYSRMSNKTTDKSLELKRHIFRTLPHLDSWDWISRDQMSVLLVYLPTVFPNFCSLKILISVTVNFRVKYYIKYTWMSSPFYQVLINSILSLPTRRGPDIFLHFSVRDHSALKNQIFWYGKVYCCNTIIITMLIGTFIPIYRFENIFFPKLELKSHNRIRLWYLEKWHVCSNFS